MSKKRPLGLFALFFVLLVAGCGKRAAERAGAGASPPAAKPASARQSDQSSSLTSATTRQSAGRRIIRNASLSMRVKDPAGAQRRASVIADKLGGYVASVTKRRHGGDASDPLDVALELRVPADRLNQALTRLRALATGVDSEQISSRDVTEESIDLDARLHTQKQLEQQYLQILKNAEKVSDALEVQKQLASVRGEIEKLEGRKRVLDNQIEMSTIKLNLEEAQPLVRASFTAFSTSIKHAGADAINVGAALVNGSIRILGVLLPVLLIFGLPAFMILRYLVRRSRRWMEASR